MKRYKIALFDVDGVLIIPPSLFAEQYCREYGVDPTHQQQFYATKEFKAASLGRFDLKEAIRLHNDMWRWQGTPEALMSLWFDAENHPNTALLKIIKQLRKDGVFVYIASQQEKYRAAYLTNVFGALVDGAFYSCDIGYAKHESAFWDVVVSRLGNTFPGVTAQDMAYFDDRENLVEKVRQAGLNSYLYESPGQVRAILSG
jgi:putative hydrolase of the HAD superfamily